MGPPPYPPSCCKRKAIILIDIKARALKDGGADALVREARDLSVAGVISLILGCVKGSVVGPR